MPSHAGAHRLLARGSVHMCHAIFCEVLTELRQRPLGAFGHPSSRGLPESDHELGLHQTDINKNIECIFLRCACCSSSSVKYHFTCWASHPANSEKIINYVLLRIANMQLKYKNEVMTCFFLLSNRLYFNSAFCSIGKKWLWHVTAHYPICGDFVAARVTKNLGLRNYSLLTLHLIGSNF